jgi:ABC-2 type transport system permease protein
MWRWEGEMRYYLSIIWLFLRASLQQELAYTTNFLVSLFYSLLGLATGVIGIAVLFNQVESIGGWNFASTLSILGVFMTLSALRHLFISPSLDALAGMDGDVWTGNLDYQLLRPIDIQFLASFRQWRPFALIDLCLGVGVLMVAISQLPNTLTTAQIVSFIAALLLGLLVLYSLLLAFAGLVFWSPGFLFGWVFDGIFEMARYPINLYPGWIRLILTWILPLGVMTTVPVRALTGVLTPGLFVGSLVLGIVLFCGATVLFRTGVSRYASASS